MFRQQVVRSSMCILMAMAIFIVGCGGHVANPVERYAPGDDKKSCETMMAEIEINKQQISEKEKKAADRDFWNLLWFAGGCVVIVPFFFMDAKGSYEVEIDALKDRNKMLGTYMADKGCSVSEPIAQDTNQ